MCIRDRPEALRSSRSGFSSLSLYWALVSRTFCLVASRTQSRRRSTVSGNMTSWYLPRLKVSRIRSAIPQIKLTISLWVIAILSSSLSLWFMITVLQRIPHISSVQDSKLPCKLLDNLQTTPIWIPGFLLRNWLLSPASLHLCNRYFGSYETCLLYTSRCV